MKAWFKGLVAAAIQGSATSVAMVIVDPHTFSDWQKVASVAGASAAVGVALYLSRSPIWRDEGPPPQSPPRS